MPPKRVATKSEAPLTTRPSRKRAAEENDPVLVKRPRRASTNVKASAETPSNKVARGKTAKTALAPKRAGATTTKKVTAKPTAAPAPAKRRTTTTATRVAKAAPAKTTEKAKAAALKPKTPRVPKPKPPPFNALPVIPPPRQYPLHVFVFGNGDAGQFGLGPDVLDEIGRPKLHSWIEEAIKEGKFGEKGAGFETLVAGGMHSIAVSPNGKLWSWGVNDEGALGRDVNNVPNPDKPGENFEREELESIPMLVTALEEQKFRPVVVSAGDSLTIAIDADGHAKGWGIFRSENGQLGFQNDSKASRIQNLPTDIPFLEKVQFSDVATGPNHAVGLSVDGKVYTWGSGEGGQLGRKIIGRRLLNSTRPDPLHLRKIVVVGAGSFHSFAVDADGHVYAWGLNQYGQLGLEIEDETIVWTPTLVPSLSPLELGNDARVTQISGGEHHTLFLLSDGRVYAAGRFDSSQLGLAPDHPATKKMEEQNRVYISTPARVFFPPEASADRPNPELPAYKASDDDQVINPIVKISVGGRASLAVSKSGHVYSWGYGASCQLGLGNDAEEQATPTRVRWKGADDWFVEDASAGGQHCFLLASERSARAAAPTQNGIMDEST